MHLIDWRVVRAWVSALATILAASGTGYLVWVQLHPESENTRLDWVSILVVGLVAVGTSFARLVRLYTVERFAERQSKVGVALRSLAWAVHYSTNQAVPVQPLGASAFVVVGFGPFKWLRRLAHERVNDSPGETLGVRWTKGKGILGVAWSSGREACVNTGRFDAQHRNCSEGEWNMLGEDDRRRLTYREYRSIEGKYGTVIVVPMIDRERVIGVVALDCPPGHHHRLDNPLVIELVANASSLITNLVT